MIFSYVFIYFIYLFIYFRKLRVVGTAGQRVAVKRSNVPNGAKEEEACRRL